MKKLLNLGLLLAFAVTIQSADAALFGSKKSKAKKKTQPVVNVSDTLNLQNNQDDGALKPAVFFKPSWKDFKQPIPDAKGENMAVLRKEYNSVTKDDRIILSLNTLQGTVGDYSRKTVLGYNITGKPIKVQFLNLATKGPQYANLDAMGWKQGSRLFIYINEKHANAPKEALAAILAHEALHQDSFNSLNEETYAWTLEGAVWTQITEKNPEVMQINHPLVERENSIKKLFEKGGYTDKFIRKTVISNPVYQSLPACSPGFDEQL